MTGTERQGACSHVPGDRPNPVCIVDDPDGNVDPVLVIRASVSRSIETDGTRPLFVDVIGELDVYAADSIASALERVEGEDGVVLDLAGVSFIDSAGLRRLEMFLDNVVISGRRVWLHEPSRVVRRLVAILQVDRFQLCESTTSRHR